MTDHPATITFVSRSELRLYPDPESNLIDVAAIERAENEIRLLAAELLDRALHGAAAAHQVSAIARRIAETAETLIRN